MEWLPGTAGTVTETTLEKRTISILYLAQMYDNNNFVNSSRDDDSRIISVTVRLPARAVVNSDGFTEFRYSNSIPVPAGVTFNSGNTSGGNSKASNLTEALVECFQLLAINERIPEKNGTGNRYITDFSFSLNDAPESTQGNAVLNITAGLPSQTVVTASGVKIEGVIYLS
jgi:hypothetical protein